MSRRRRGGRAMRGPGPRTTSEPFKMAMPWCPLSEQTLHVTSAPVPHQDDARPPQTVWIFHGDEARFAAGVFTSREQGLAWAERHGVSGILTEYPVGDG